MINSRNLLMMRNIILWGINSCYDVSTMMGDNDEIY